MGGKRLERFLQDWMLPLAIVAGITLYLVYHYVPALHLAGGVLHVVASEGQRIVIAILLFFQFVKVSPHDLRWQRWHGVALIFQTLTFLVCSAFARVMPDGGGRILVECAMLCLICPTASAAGVITEKVGGDLAQTVTYLVMINVAATLLIPTVIPMVRPAADLGFWQYVVRIALRIFPVLILPCLLAWTIRYTTHRLQRMLMRWSRYSFYVWGVGLTLAMVLSTRALVLSRLGAGTILCIVLVSVACCAVQFWFGRHSCKGRIHRLTAGQALGQKNTGFLIWLGYNYLTPVTSVAGGLYAIWQNLYNAWELHQAQETDKKQ